MREAKSTSHDKGEEVPTNTDSATPVAAKTSQSSLPEEVQAQVDVVTDLYQELDSVVMRLVADDFENPNEANKALHDAIEVASSASEANLDLVLQLIKTPSTPETDALLASFIADLKPGPYSQYIFQAMSENGTLAAPVRESLSSTLSNWQQTCGDSTLYAKDVAQLGSLLSPPKSTWKSFLTSVRSYFSGFAE